MVAPSGVVTFARMEERSAAVGRAEGGGWAAQPSRDLRSRAALPARVRRLALAAWLPVLIWVTLTPVPRTGDPDEPISPWCLVCGDRGTADAILNLLFFVPLGLALANGRRSMLQALLVGASISGAVEVAQIVVPGRYSNPGDVLWNGAGAWVGFLVAGFLVRRARTNTRWAGPLVALLIGAAFLWAGWLLEHAPTGAAYYGQWTADLGFMPQYEGEVRSATLDGLSLPSTRLDSSVDAARRLAADWTIQARVAKGPAPDAVSPIVSIYDAEETEILVLGAYGDDLVLRERTRAKALRLDHPDLRLEGALAPHATGEVLAMGARRVGDSRCLSVDDVETCGLGFTPGRTWGLLLYLEGLSEQGRAVLDAAWMLALFVPIGLLADSPRSVAAAGVVAALGLSIAALVTRLTAPTWAEAAAACAGLVLGQVAVRRAQSALTSANA
jgi:VanZ family protein